MNAHTKAALLIGVGAIIGAAVVVVIARRRMKKLPLWRRLLLALAVKK